MKLISIILLYIIMTSLVGATVETLGTFEQNECVNLLQTCSNCSYVKVVSVKLPNSVTLNLNSSMEKYESTYNLTFCNTTQLGEYIVNTEGDGVVAPYDFYITYNGREAPSEIVIVFFSLGFLIVIGFLSYLIIYNIGHLGQMDYDLGDLIKNVSAYFVLLGLYMLSIFYLGNEMIDSILGWIIGITGFTNVAMSFLFFIIVLLAKRKAEVENAW